MALVDRLVDALPKPMAVDARLLERAAGPGRVRGAAVDIGTRALEHPLLADAIVRDGLRAARQLHSAERRFVAEALWQSFRWAEVVDRLVPSKSPADRATVRFDAWLVRCGRPPTRGFAAFADLETATAGLLRGRSPVEQLAIGGSLSTPLAQALWSSLGEAAGDFLVASNGRAPLALRANRARTTRDALVARLGREGLVARRSELAIDGVVAQEGAAVERTEAFAAGDFEVQDEGSQMLGALVDGKRVIDWCAGAGGKSLQLAAVGKQVIACDVRHRALDELERRARRAGVRIKTWHLPTELPDFEVDAVLVDAPCSGTGTLRRHPELRLRLDAAALAGFPKTQAEILDAASACVRPGGQLVYATCSVLDAENGDVARGFLVSHPEFTGHEALRVAPHTHGTDAFTAWVMRRQG